MRFPLISAAAVAICVSLVVPAPADEEVAISAAAKGADGVLIHDVRSPYQSGKTTIRVLLPSERKAGERYPVIYLLPVEPRQGDRYGDGMAEARQQGLHDKFGVIFVEPTFSHLPWYADHPSRPEIRQETYFLKVVVPLVEKTYPAKAQAQDRLLLGFSKSGWGAWSLLLRHPDLFGKAAAWDAPLMMDQVGKYGSAEIFGTQENFEKYRIELLLRAQAKKLGQKNRLVLTGYGNFRDQHQRLHDLLTELKIQHSYRDGPQRKHDWHSGWVSEAAELLLYNDKRE